MNFSKSFIKRITLRILRKPHLNLKFQVKVLALTIASSIPLFMRETKSLESTDSPINLSKDSYLTTLWGNNSDFFLIVIYEDRDPDIARSATKFAKDLKMKLKSPINVYLLPRRTFNDIKLIINRGKAKEIFPREDPKRPIECFLKTPYSEETAYFKPSPKKINSIVKSIEKYHSMITSIDNLNELKEKMKSSSLTFNTPLLIINSLNYEKLIFNAIERKILPRSSPIILVNPKLSKSLGLLKEDGVWIMRNDVLNSIKDENDKNQSISLNFESEKYSLEEFKEDAEIKEYCENNNIIQTQDFQFQNFLIPKIIFLQNSKFKNLGPLFRQMSLKRSKLVLSLYLVKKDSHYEERLSTLKAMYNTYKSELIFLICTGNMEELFPHITPHSPKFTLFQMFQKIQNEERIEDYYGNLSIPYLKYFFRQDDSLFETPEALEPKISSILKGEVAPEYISTSSDIVKTIDSRILSKYYENGPSDNTLILLHKDDNNSMNALNSISDFALNTESLANSLNFEKMPSNSEGKNFQMLQGFPSFLYFLRNCKESAHLILSSELPKSKIDGQVKEFITLASDELQRKCFREINKE